MAADGAESGGLSRWWRAAQARVDPLGWAPATAGSIARSSRHPVALSAAALRLATGAARLPLETARNAFSLDSATSVGPDPADARFKHPAWGQNPYFFAVRQAYQLGCRFVDDVLDAGRGDEIDDLKAAMVLHLLTDALSPTNFLATNPAALMSALQTGGKSVARGALLAFDDVRHRRGMPAKVDASAFTLGQDLAATPGAVVFRNDLIELIQYAPQTGEVHAVPLLGSPPWINKYYVLDLAPRRSLVEWAVKHGRTVFMISYRNPDESMRDYSMDDYLEQGILAALDVIAEITHAEKVDVVALCLGGAMAAMASAYLAARNDDRIGSLTLLNTMLDYSAPGELRAFADPESVARIKLRMRGRGFLEAQDMAMAFDLLRARDLIFRYVPDRWLMGEQAAPFDILAWNGDSTRMPAAMHSTYLAQLYGENRLARGCFELGGKVLDLDAVKADTYIVGAVNDHIVPWHASYASTGLLGGDTRYVLSSGGHIAGAVNPPSSKAWFETSEAPTEDPEVWRAEATRSAESWWEDWADWSAARAGERVAAPSDVGSARHPALGGAPGQYVRS